MDNFKKASKEKLRFNTSKGVLSVEQLWDLTLTDLSALIKGVNKLLKGIDDDSLGFLDAQNTVDETQQLRFDVLKDIYLTKKADNEAARTAKETRERNQKILGLIAEKKEESLKGKTIEELEAMLK